MRKAVLRVMHLRRSCWLALGSPIRSQNNSSCKITCNTTAERGEWLGVKRHGEGVQAAASSEDGLGSSGILYPLTL
eukprot:6474733-Amphidinium_carterae.1